MNIGDVLVTTKDVGGWSREFVPAGSQGTVTQTRPLQARFIVNGRPVEVALYDGEWR